MSTEELRATRLRLLAARVFANLDSAADDAIARALMKLEAARSHEEMTECVRNARQLLDCLTLP